MRASQSIFDRRENMDAQKFGHSVGQFFKKIDRTLSFLPEKPRKAVVVATAFAASPVLASVIVFQARNNSNSVDVTNVHHHHNSSIVDEIDLSNVDAINRNISYFDEDSTMFDNLDSENFFGEKY